MAVGMSLVPKRERMSLVAVSRPPGSAQFNEEEIGPLSVGPSKPGLNVAQGGRVDGGVDIKGEDILHGYGLGPRGKGCHEGEYQGH